MFFVSTIIPVYNASKYLHRCLDSLVKMDTEGIWHEIIVINDGSTDDSLAICESYAQSYSSVKVFSQSNQGPSAARNLGIQNSEGDYIVFVDSDDFVEKRYIKNLLKYSNADVDLVINGFQKINSGNKVIETLQWEQQEINGEDLFILFEDLKLYNYGYPFSKLFSKSIIIENNVFFNTEVKMFEDALFLMTYLKCCRRIVLSPHTDYIYYHVEGSLSNRLHSFKSEFASFISLFNLSLYNYSISENQLLKKYKSLGYRIATLMNRTIVVLYRSDFTREERLSLLKKYPVFSWCLYNEYYRPKSLVKKMLKFILLENKRIGDLLLAAIYKFIK